MFVKQTSASRFGPSEISLCLILATVLTAAPVFGDDVSNADASNAEASNAEASSAKVQSAGNSKETDVKKPAADSGHPLDWTLRYATSRADYVRDHIRDYACRLIKRERIKGKLQETQFMQLRVRCEQREDDKLVKPTAVFVHYQAPSRLKNRRLLFIDGQNNGRVLVRKGGSAMNFLKIKVDPLGSAAQRESNYPITDVGFDKIIERLIRLAESDIKLDPNAENTKVAHFRNAKVDKRSCTHIRVDHPKKQDGFEFARASLYIDDELQVPVRLVVYDWPENPADEPELIEEYTYVKLKINVGMTDAHFDAQRLGLLDRPKK